jgi:anti-anti-sigma factor
LSPPGVTLCETSGELDLATYGSVRKRLPALLEADAPIVFDLRGLTFIDGAGLGLLIEFDAVLRGRHGRAPRWLVSPVVERVLEFRGYRNWLEVVADVNAALDVGARPPAD